MQAEEITMAVHRKLHALPIPVTNEKVGIDANMPSVSGVAGPHLLPVIPIRLAVFLTLSFILHSKIILPVIQSGKYYSSMTER